MSGQQFFDDGTTQGYVHPQTGVVTFVQEETGAVRMTPNAACRMAFMLLFNLAPEVLDERIEMGVSDGNLMAVGLASGGTLLLSLDPPEDTQA